MAVHTSYAIVKDGEIKRMAHVDAYAGVSVYEIDRIARIEQGEDAECIDVTQYPVWEGCKYIDGHFYTPDGTKEIEYVPTVEQDFSIYKQQEGQNSKLLRTAASFAAMTFTDAQALQVTELYPDWNCNGIAYKTGERVRYNGTLYKVLAGHTSQEDWIPDVTPSLYAKVLIPDSDIIPAWEQPESTNGYMVGDKVTHNGKTWESLADNNVWEPGAEGVDQWKEV